MIKPNQKRELVAENIQQHSADSIADHGNQEPDTAEEVIQSKDITFS